MTVTLNLRPEVESTLRRMAEREGQDLAIYMQSIMEREANKDAQQSDGTAADLFAGRLGGIHSGGQGRWSENAGEKFAAGMEEKRRQGHL